MCHLDALLLACGDLGLLTPRLCSECCRECSWTSCDTLTIAITISARRCNTVHVMRTNYATTDFESLRMSRDTIVRIVHDKVVDISDEVLCDQHTKKMDIYSQCWVIVEEEERLTRRSGKAQLALSIGKFADGQEAIRAGFSRSMIPGTLFTRRQDDNAGQNRLEWVEDARRNHILLTEFEMHSMNEQRPSDTRRYGDMAGGEEEEQRAVYQRNMHCQRIDVVLDGVFGNALEDVLGTVFPVGFTETLSASGVESPAQSLTDWDFTVLGNMSEHEFAFPPHDSTFGNEMDGRDSSA